VIHKYAHSSINTIPLYIEDLVVKILGYFHIFSQSRTAERFCDFVGQEYKDILAYTQGRNKAQAMQAMA
jgi:hypothetical protein